MQRVDVGVAVKRHRADKRRQHAQIDEALQRQIERRICGGDADGAAEQQRILGDRPRGVGDRRALPFDELDARRPLLLDGNAGERELRGVEDERAVDRRPASAPARFAAPLAEKLPTTPPVATLPVMRDDGELLALERGVDGERLHRVRARRPS